MTGSKNEESEQLNKVKAKFHWRGFFSFSTAIFFLIMAITGIMLYLAPRFFTPPTTPALKAAMLAKRNNIIALHTIASYAFIIVSIAHFIINWKTFKSYISRNTYNARKAKSFIRLKYELILALVVAIVIMAAVLLHLPPFQTIMDAGRTEKVISKPIHDATQSMLPSSSAFHKIPQ